MELNIRNYPIVLLKDMESLLKDLKYVAGKSEDVIKIQPEGNDIFIARESHPDSQFIFKVYKPVMRKEPEYNFLKVPHSLKSIAPYEGSCNHLSLVNIFKGWIDNVKEYHTIAFNEEDSFEKKYEQEFYEDFKIMDEDAKESTFNFSQQILLNNYIENAIIYLEQTQSNLEEKDRMELLEEAKQIQKSISIESKDSVIKRNSKFWAKARKKSISVCKFILTEFAKEVLKEGAKVGIHFAKENLPYYIEHIKALLS
jgi:hypothetical protein